MLYNKTGIKMTKRKKAEETGENEEETEEMPTGYTLVCGVAVPNDILQMTQEERGYYAVQLRKGEAKYREIEEITGLTQKSIASFLRIAGMTKGAMKKAEETGKNEEESVSDTKKTRSNPGKAAPAAPTHAAPIRTLDESYANVLTHLTGKLDWFTDALVNIGFFSMIIALQSATVQGASMDEVLTNVSKYDDPTAFTEDVKTYLVALWQAKEDAHALVNMEHETQKLKMELEYVLTGSRQIAQKYQDATSRIQLALSCMCEDCQKRLAWTSMMGGLQAVPAAQPQQLQQNEYKVISPGTGTNEERK